ncbi:MAG: helix-turn-helix domain-containing protein [Chloroflexi bacterium]|nr:helix-turn-helix domain-containing protein [Chloroflexota bacterium]
MAQRGVFRMAPQQLEALLSVAQAATLLGVHPNTIRSWTSAGRLTAYRINRRGDRRFRRDDVERLLVAGTAASAADAADAATHGPAAREAELAVFERVAVGLAATPAPGSVARVLVEAELTERSRSSPGAVRSVSCSSTHHPSTACRRRLCAPSRRP